MSSAPGTPIRIADGDSEDDEMRESSPPSIPVAQQTARAVPSAPLPPAATRRPSSGSDGDDDDDPLDRTLDRLDVLVASRVSYPRLAMPSTTALDDGAAVSLEWADEVVSRLPPPPSEGAATDDQALLLLPHPHLSHRSISELLHAWTDAGAWSGVSMAHVWEVGYGGDNAASEPGHVVARIPRWPVSVRLLYTLDTEVAKPSLLSETIDRSIAHLYLWRHATRFCARGALCVYEAEPREDNPAPRLKAFTASLDRLQLEMGSADTTMHMWWRGHVSPTRGRLCGYVVSGAAAQLLLQRALPVDGSVEEYLVMMSRVLQDQVAFHHHLLVDGSETTTTQADEPPAVQGKQPLLPPAEEAAPKKSSWWSRKTSSSTAAADQPPPATNEDPDTGTDHRLEDDPDSHTSTSASVHRRSAGSPSPSQSSPYGWMVVSVAAALLLVVCLVVVAWIRYARLASLSRNGNGRSTSRPANARRSPPTATT